MNFSWEDALVGTGPVSGDTARGREKMVALLPSCPGPAYTTVHTQPRCSLASCVSAYRCSWGQWDAARAKERVTGGSCWL